MADLREPPRTISGVLRSLGPGVIIAGSIVGSGELIATTKVGAQAGFALLWLILIGCAIKVFTQVEIGRYTVTHNRTPLEGLNEVPGPRWRVNWIVWYWAIMTGLVIVQQGGIAGGVGQALAIQFPLTEAGQQHNQTQDELTLARIDAAIEEREVHSETSSANTAPHDEVFWTILVCVATALLLAVGRFKLIEWVSAILVAGFTLVTILTLILLQTKPQWAIQSAELQSGLGFRLPPATSVGSPLMTALSAFGIIGVGAVELIMYPYWCLEKGYAKYTGRDDGTAGWVERAKGWMRVMRVDAWLSMVVYTLATVGFYLLGAAVLHRVKLDPQSGDMIRTLSQMYVPVFGSWARGVFLVGAFSVLYSTLFVAAAGNARMVADGLCLMGILHHDEATRMRWSKIISVIWPLLAGVLYIVVRDAPRMVLLCGTAQMLMLPLLGIAALWFRYQRSIKSLEPGRLWDLLLWISVLGFFLTAGSYMYSKLPSFFAS